MIKIQAEDLARITKNCMMFVNPKSIWLPGEMLFDLTENTITCYACDDYFAVTDSASLAGGLDTAFVLSLADVKELEAFSRQNKKDEVLISFNGDGVTFASNDEALTFVPGELRDNWDTVEDTILYPADEVAITGYMSNPERYAKLSQLKYDKNKDCIIWQHVESPTGQLIIRFSVGETLKGAIMPLKKRQEEVEEIDDGSTQA